MQVAPTPTRSSPPSWTPWASRAGAPRSAACTVHCRRCARLVVLGGALLLTQHPAIHLSPSAPQAAAASALAQAADHICGLEPSLLRGLLRAANNPLFQGRAELWGAVARLEDGRVRGLLAGSFQTVLAAWPEVQGAAGGERWGGGRALV